MNHNRSRGLELKLRYTLLLLLLCTFNSFSQSASKRDIIEAKKVWNQVYYSNWESEDSTKYWYPIAIEAVNTYSPNRYTGRITRYIARQTHFVELGLSKDSVRNTFKWLHLKIQSIDSVYKYRNTLYQYQGLWLIRNYQYDSAFYYTSLALADSQKNLAACTPDTYSSALISLANNYNNAGYAIYQTTNNKDSPEEKAEITPKILYYFLKSDSLTKIINTIQKNPCHIFNAAILNIANVYGHYSVDRNLSNRYFQEILRQAEACHDAMRIGQIYNALSFCILNAGDTTNAIAAAKTSLLNLKQTNTSFSRIARFEANSILSKLYYYRHQYDSTIKYGYNVLSDTAFITRPIEVSFVSSVMAESYLKQGDHVTAYKMLAISYKHLNRNTSEKQQRSITETIDSDSERLILSRLDRVQSLIDKSNNLNQNKILFASSLVAILVLSILFFALKLRKRVS